MPAYQAPLRDMRFVLNELFDAAKLWAELPELAQQMDGETADAILEQAASISAGLLAPLNRSGDEEGAAWVDGRVRTPAGFRDAYATYSQGGWVGLSGNPEHGGLGAPKMLSVLVEEMLYATNSSFALYSVLSSGACQAIDAHATQALKALYLPAMYEGRWAGSMCLTEAHAGTDLGLLRTRAEPAGGGTYHITGSKIFITGGEQDLTENIIHLVLARLPDAPPGAKGISLFLVPKVLVNADGSLGAPNALNCGSIEHKMGIKASATCVMNFDGASGWLIGEPHRGLAAMFTMMNYERLSIGIQGLGCAEASLQSARAYAQDRLQGRAPRTATQGVQTADPIIVHGDVRRMLLGMKAMTEGGRAFAVYVARQLDLARYSPDSEQRTRAAARVALLTPVAKAFFTDTGLESCIQGQQVFGGHGYIREWGQEQLVRDVRIAQIYEGTNGVQALDLLGRKVLGDDCQMLESHVQEMLDYAGSEGCTYGPVLRSAVKRLLDLSHWLRQEAVQRPEIVSSSCVEYLHLFGYVTYAWLWAQMAEQAQRRLQSDEAFYASKFATAKFFYARLLPRVESLDACIRNGSESMYSLQGAQI